MQITITVSTDEGDLTLKRTFTVTRDERTEHIQAAATLLNVSMAVVEEIERKGTTHTCDNCAFRYKKGNWCLHYYWYNPVVPACDMWKQKE